MNDLIDYRNDKRISGGTGAPTRERAMAATTPTKHAIVGVAYLCC